jgi:hypothetical protein
MTSSTRTLLALLFILVLAPACAPDPAGVIIPGQTRAEVREAAGEPDEVQVFTLPAEPFFGPQEGLANLLPAGTLVEEWQYLTEDEVTYVWFTGVVTDSQAVWTVVDTATHPADAVY